jgi:hypothetical protein
LQGAADASRGNVHQLSGEVARLCCASTIAEADDFAATLEHVDDGFAGVSGARRQSHAALGDNLDVSTEVFRECARQI